jgi:hypothetical protein
MKAKLFVPVLLVLVLIGCASFSDNAYRTLDFQATLYESAKDLANGLPADTWTDVEKVEIEKVAKRYRIAYHAALEAMIDYEEIKSKGNMDLVTAALDKMKEFALAFSKLVERW